MTERPDLKDKMIDELRAEAEKHQHLQTHLENLVRIAYCEGFMDRTGGAGFEQSEALEKWAVSDSSRWIDIGAYEEDQEDPALAQYRGEG